MSRNTDSKERPHVKSDSAAATRVCLLWRHPLMLAEFRRVLSNEPIDIRVEPGVSGSLEDLLPGDIRLVVVEFDGQASGDDVMQRLVTLGLSGRTIVLAEAFGETTAFQLLRFGVKGIVTFSEASQHLPRILREILKGGFWVPRAVLSRFVEATLTENAPRRPPAQGPSLTPREREVLDDLLKNRSNKEIARKLRISGRTAKFHVSNVMAKYGVKRRADLLLLSLPQH